MRPRGMDIAFVTALMENARQLEQRCDLLERIVREQDQLLARLAPTELVRRPTAAPARPRAPLRMEAS